MKLGKTLVKIRDQQAQSEEMERLMTDFRDDMLARGKWAIEVSNPVLEDYGKYAADYKFGTFGKEAAPIEVLNLQQSTAETMVSA